MNRFLSDTVSSISFNLNSDSEIYKINCLYHTYQKRQNIPNIKLSFKTGIKFIFLNHKKTYEPYSIISIITAVQVNLAESLHDRAAINIQNIYFYLSLIQAIRKLFFLLKSVESAKKHTAQK